MSGSDTFFFCVGVIYCNNGKNLKGMSREHYAALRLLGCNSIKHEAEKLKICCKFNPPSAPHVVGAFREKLIDSVKTFFRFVLKNRHPSEKVLHTLLVEAEHSINSRPLIHVSCDPRDGDEGWL